MKTVYDRSVPGRTGFFLPELEVPAATLPVELTRESLSLPEMGERDVVAHYTNLSTLNFGVDNGFYPLGSCTMKYNPRINEDGAALPGFADLHPATPSESTQGALRLMWELEQQLCAVTGMAAFTLQPAAGAHGELTGVMIMKAHFDALGQTQRRTILIPDSAHGTNPATAAFCGFDVKTVPSDEHGEVDLAALAALVDETTVGLMLTNPNTLGLFDRRIGVIAQILHERGALFYCDGANANAVLGVARIADMGFDIVHLNLHKSFSTPHGGGGPGSGPVGVVAKLEGYLPVPRVVNLGDRFVMQAEEGHPHTLGRMKGFFGHFGMLIRAYAYLSALGEEGVAQIGRQAVLNANYLRVRLQTNFNLPYNRVCQHEFVLNDEGVPNGIKTLDIAKRLIDYGVHPPTVYFPINVSGALMIEPTETEALEALDAFVAAMEAVLQEAASDPDLLHRAPVTTAVSRFDEVAAARKPALKHGD
ncbi:MAG: glycine dehydrogenase (aminomethyl-transferring) [Alphaproteobacteria bacterium CG_4_10_14_0_2_um_filter_63_37]|nr:MAG: glycine dehydrogenase (aminomethyl-transferring) [Proteobacteria bacterium CG1_02_64_396]PJA23810.1 MAG: glycine dehydrogenase (aminomethyl-transferring) [Alphaproteobacteria bacterium CG_4_10_14_0_2_um_filter_63_37]